MDMKKITPVSQFKKKYLMRSLLKPKDHEGMELCLLKNFGALEQLEETSPFFASQDKRLGLTQA